MPIDPAGVVAIDVHVHVEQDGHGCLALDQELLDASAAYFKADQDRTPTIDAIAEHYRARRIAAVVFTVDAPSGTGHPPLSSEEIADAAAAHADVLIPFGSVDPHTGKAAVARARRLVTEHGVRGFKFHPSLQAFEPNDMRFYPLYDAIAELGVPALFHTGQTGIGAGLPGGRGIKLRYSNPMLLDDVAADHPDLTVVLAHRRCPGRTRRSRSPPTSPTCTSTCRDGRRSTSRRSWCARRTRCCAARCCSARTTRSSPRTGGSRTSRPSR